MKPQDHCDKIRKEFEDKSRYIPDNIDGVDYGYYAIAYGKKVFVDSCTMALWIKYAKVNKVKKELIYGENN